MPKIKINKGCRICYEQNSSLVDIYQKNETEISHFNKLIKIVPDLKDAKKASRKICEVCVTELNSAYNFYEKCINSTKPRASTPTPQKVLRILLPDLKYDKNYAHKFIGYINDSISEENDSDNLNISLNLPESSPSCSSTSNLRNGITLLSPNRLRESPIVRLEKLGEASNKKSESPRKEISPPTNSQSEIVKEKPKEEMKKCVMCNQEFTNVEGLQVHFKNAHAVSKLFCFDYKAVKSAIDKETHKFITDVNDRISKRNSLLENSQTILNNISKDSSIDCNMTDITDAHSELSNETDQMSIKENDKPVSDDMELSNKKKKKYECLYCGKILDKKVQLTKHLQLHEISVVDKKNFKCQYCDETFSELTHLYLHARAHENKEVFQCHTCLTVCGSAGALKAHMHVHDKRRKFKNCGYVPHKDGGFKCLKCGMRLSSRGSINAHVARHSPKKPFRCTHCPSAFKTKSCLIQHLNLMHAPVNYPCTVCDRNFNYKYALLQHLATHTQELKT